MARPKFSRMSEDDWVEEALEVEEELEQKFLEAQRRFGQLHTGFEHPFSLDESVDSDALSARLTEQAGSSSCETSGDSQSETLSAMKRLAQERAAAPLGAEASTVKELQEMGFGHLAAFANVPLASTAPLSATPTNPLIALADLPSAALSQTCRLPLNRRRPGELELPGSRSSSRPSSGDSWADRGGGRRACTPILRRAKMVSPDEADGVMAHVPHERDRPGEYARRRRPWHSAAEW